MITRIAWITALVCLTLFGVYQLSKSRTYQVFGTMLTRVETDDKVVALTFDDGPTAEATPQILRMLADEGVRASFYLIGQDIARAPDAAKAIADAGHEIGNHTYQHNRMVFKSWSFIKDEIERTDALIRATGYTGTIHFRAPYGKRLLLLPYYLQQNNRTHVFYDVEPESFKEVDASKDAIVAHVLEKTRPGSIILLHVMYPSRQRSLKAVPEIIRGLKSKGFQFVTVSELMTLGSKG